MAKEYELLVKEARELKEKHDKDTCIYKLFGLTVLSEIYTTFLCVILLLLNNIINFKDNTFVLVLSFTLWLILVFLLLYEHIKGELSFSEKNSFRKNTMVFLWYATLYALVIFYADNILFTKELVEKIIIALAIHLVLVLMCKNIKNVGIYILSSVIFIIAICCINKFLISNLFGIKDLVWYMLVIAFFSKSYDYKINNSSNYLKNFNMVKYFYLFNVHLAFILLIEI